MNDSAISWAVAGAASPIIAKSSVTIVAAATRNGRRGRRAQVECSRTILSMDGGHLQ